MTPGQVVSEAPLYDSIWGAFQPGTWYQNHPSMIVSRYVLPNEDVKLISGHDFNWWNTNHPDWILYACLADGTPTHDLAGTGTNFGNIPLDIHNPAVVDYQIRQLVGPDMISEHYNTVAADNITFVNYLYDQSQPVSSHAYGCGIWQGNTFIRRYGPPTGGDFDQPDQAFINDLTNWLAQTRQILNTDPTLAPHHFKIVVNHPFVGGFGPTQQESNMLQYVDGFLDESGFTHYGGRVTQNSFAQTLSWAVYAQSNHLAIFFADYFCSASNTNPDTGQPCSTNPQTLTGAEIDWALATYALINNGGTNVFISPEGGAIYTYRSEYSDRYGAPCTSSFTSNGNYVYTRKFAGGFAVVNAANANTIPQTVQLPQGHTYTDIGSRPISNPLTINGADAYMLQLTSSGNGCT